MPLSLKSLFNKKRPLLEIPVEELTDDELIESYEQRYQLKLISKTLKREQLLEAHRLAEDREEN